MIAMAILAALVLGAAGTFALGTGAAIWMGSLYGSNSGGTEMSSFFTFGPAGAFAGVLLGVGLVFRFGGGPANWAKGLMIGSGSIFGLAMLGLVGLALAHPAPVARTPSFTLVFEVEVPLAQVAGQPNSAADWNYTADRTYTITSIEKDCSADRCLFKGLVALNETLTKGTLTAVLGQDHFTFPVEPPGPQPTDWSEWQSRGAARFRWKASRS